MTVRIHRNLNDRGGEGWVITPKGGKSYRVASVVVRVDSVKISASTLARIRTPKGEQTPSGAQGLGKRTVGAWLVGELYAGEFQPTSSTIHFNPFIDDNFKIQKGGKFSTFTGGAVLHFTTEGSVEVCK